MAHNFQEVTFSNCVKLFQRCVTCVFHNVSMDQNMTLDSFTQSRVRELNFALRVRVSVKRSVRQSVCFAGFEVNTTEIE